MAFNYFKNSSIAYAMVDCNNFYASCERVFNPTLAGKPIVILSNNDGCVIARSQEAKDIGVPMGAPEFKYRKFFKENNVVVRSSNYALYGEMSDRVMDILNQLSHNIEVYSIDEAFALVSTNVFDDLNEYGSYIRNTIQKWTGLPVSVGIASSKTLAKVANGIAKHDSQTNGVLCFEDSKKIDQHLKHIPIQKIWGIGAGMTVRLNRYNITTALDLKQTINNKKWVKKNLHITGLRTVLELNGIPCIKMGEALDKRKGILTSRMFGKPIYELEHLQEAISTYVSRATEKLRAQESVASILHVTLIGDKYSNLKGQYKYTTGTSLQVPTAHTPTLINLAKGLVNHLYIENTKYKKAGVSLTGIIPNTEVQMDLFDPHLYTQQQFKLMECLDQINSKYGRNKAAFASTGLHKEKDHRNKWLMNQNHLSKRYTTRWDELMIAKTK
ncbi:MAG: Y-family DNA polymerase [Balneola sp.]